MLRRLGLLPRSEAEDAELAQALWDFLQASRAPFEQMFFDWFCGAHSTARAARSPSAEFYDGPIFDAFRTLLQPYEPAHPARLGHAYFAGSEPCTMLIDEVERIWAPVAESDDWSAFHAKLDAIATLADAYETTPDLP